MHFFTSSANATGCPLLPLSLSFFLLHESHLVLSLSLSLFLVLFIPLFLCLSIFPHFHLFSSIYFSHFLILSPFFNLLRISLYCPTLLFNSLFLSFFTYIIFHLLLFFFLLFDLFFHFSFKSLSLYLH